MISIVIGVLLICGALFVIYVGFRSTTDDGAVVILGFLLLTIFSLPLVISALNHAYDIGVLKTQHLVIDVYEQRVNELKQLIKTEDGFIQQDNTLLANNDNPIGAVVQQLAEATRDLASVRVERVTAIKGIVRRKAGPFWFVVTIMGDPTTELKAGENQ